MKRPELTIPTVLGILVLLVGMGTGLWFLREPLRTTIRADSETAPGQVTITNITDSSFAVSWITTRAAGGYIQYGEEANPNLVVSDDRDQELGKIEDYFTHFVTIRGLKPATSYAFRIGSARQLYDQQGSPYQVTTGLRLGSPPAADVAYGQVLTASGEPAEGAIVYLTLAGAVPQAALVKSSGAWVVPLSTVRSTDLTSWTAYDTAITQIQLQVQAGPLGSASVATTTGQDSPVPTISLGQTYNHLARAEKSKLSLAVSGQPTATIVLLSPKSGEEINSTQPEIIGRGPADSEITITINSATTITDTVTTDKNGEFSYTVPQNLPPGEHTVTVSTLVDGVVKKVQRRFTVLAAGESQIPAFTATPAATLKPTPTLAPRISLPSTQSGVPASGNLTPTLILLILGTGLITSGIITYKKLA